MKLMFKNLTFVILFVLLVSCEYKAPLISENNIAIDASLLGFWEFINPDPKDEPENKVHVLFLKFSETEYLIHYTEKKDNLYMRAYPIKIGNIVCLQLQIIGNDAPVAQDEKKLWLVYSWQIIKGDLEIKNLNEQLVSDKIEDTKSLKKAFLKEINNKDLFINAGRFKRIIK